MTDEDKWQCLWLHGRERLIAQLQLSFEEADLQTQVHVLDVVEAGHNLIKLCDVISSDTDIVISLLITSLCFFSTVLKSFGSGQV